MLSANSRRKPLTTTRDGSAFSSSIVREAACHMAQWLRLRAVSCQDVAFDLRTGILCIAKRSGSSRTSSYKLQLSLRQLRRCLSKSSATAIHRRDGKESEAICRRLPPATQQRSSCSLVVASHGSAKHPDAELVLDDGFQLTVKECDLFS